MHRNFFRYMNQNKINLKVNNFLILIVNEKRVKKIVSIYFSLKNNYLKRKKNLVKG